MKFEIESAANFLSNLLKLHSNILDCDQLEKFKIEIESSLSDHYENHWFPDQPNKGSGYRCIRINHKMDPILTKAGLRVGLTNARLNHIFPNELTLWIDPKEVCYRIGENGSICVLFDGNQSPSSDSELSSSSSSSSGSSPSSSISSSPPNGHVTNMMSTTGFTQGSRFQSNSNSNNSSNCRSITGAAINNSPAAGSQNRTKIDSSSSSSMTMLRSPSHHGYNLNSSSAPRGMVNPTLGLHHNQAVMTSGHYNNSNSNSNNGQRHHHGHHHGHHGQRGTSPTDSSSTSSMSSPSPSSSPDWCKLMANDQRPIRTSPEHWQSSSSAARGGGVPMVNHGYGHSSEYQTQNFVHSSPMSSVMQTEQQSHHQSMYGNNYGHHHSSSLSSSSSSSSGHHPHPGSNFGSNNYNSGNSNMMSSRQSQIAAAANYHHHHRHNAGFGQQQPFWAASPF